MVSLYTFQTPPGRCSYLPDRVSQMRYEVVGELSGDEYAGFLVAGWRRFGHALFRPACPSCDECRSLRVDAVNFRPSETQRRVWRQNADAVTLTVGEPRLTTAKLDLYDRFHAAQSERVGWPYQEPKSAAGYRESFVTNPFPAEEWCYWLEGKLVGVGYVDRLSVGLSLVYFFHDPDERKRSLGVFNVLSALDRAKAAGLPHVYLGYAVEGCRSLEYKAKYRPHELVGPDGEWRPA